jgi:hypothetical protein
MLTGLMAQGRLRQSLSKLLFAPGALTREYAAGRRARYLRPFQLYLMTSVIVFAAVPLFGLNLSLRFYGEQGIHLQRSSRLAATGDQVQGPQITSMQWILDHLDTAGVRRFRALSPDDKFELLRSRRAPYVSYFVLFLVPAFALALGLFFRSRRRRYSEHLVFGLHCQSFLLLMLLAESKLPALLANALSFWAIAYFALALKRVYGGTWAGILGRGCAILGLCLGIFFIANLLLVLALLAI